MKKWIALLSLFPAFAQAMQFGVPVACDLGRECFVQNYVDVDRAKESWRDFACGNLSYDGHDGTDFRLKDFVAMERGVNVIAAAPGMVSGFRDGMPDTGVSDPAAIKDKECGNGVMVNHTGGWQTQYCHLKKGSITVHKGQMVKVGETLGQVGYSGQTAFPHLHLTIRKDGKVLDPFTAAPAGQVACGTAPAETLWQTPIPYQPTALLNASLTTSAPDVEGVRRGRFAEVSMKPDAPMLVAWSDIMGVQAGDKLRTQIFTPEGAVFLDKEEVIANPKVLYFSYAGRRRPEGLKWENGSYTGTITLLRGGVTVFQQSLRITVTK